MASHPSLYTVPVCTWCLVDICQVSERRARPGRHRGMRSRGALPGGSLTKKKCLRRGGTVGLWLVVGTHRGKGLREDTISRSVLLLYVSSS